MRFFTPNDSYHRHAILGFICLAHFFGRSLLWLSNLLYGIPIYDHIAVEIYGMYFDEGLGTLCLILLHLMLSMSSMQFNVPPRRLEHRYIIWEEYRLHSFIFSMRHISCMLLWWINKRYQLDVYTVTSRSLVTASTMLIADVISSQNPSSSTIRNTEGLSKINKLLFSFAQMLATSGVIFYPRVEIHFLMLFIVQGNAFLMTLIRKKAISNTAGLVIYGTALAVGICAYLRIILSFVYLAPSKQVGILLPIYALIIRINGGNKYLIWCTGSALVAYVEGDMYNMFGIIVIFSNCLLLSKIHQ